MRVANYIKDTKTSLSHVLTTKTPAKIAGTVALGAILLASAGLSLGISNTPTPTSAQPNQQPALAEATIFPEIVEVFPELERATSNDAAVFPEIVEVFPELERATSNDAAVFPEIVDVFPELERTTSNDAAIFPEIVEVFPELEQ